MYVVVCWSKQRPAFCSVDERSPRGALGGACDRFSRLASVYNARKPWEVRRNTQVKANR